MAKKKSTYFDIFKEECLYWIDVFGLHYDLLILEKEGEGANRAQTGADHSSKNVVIFFNTSWGDGDPEGQTDESVRRAAFHEVCEVLLNPIDTMLSLYYTEHLIEPERHRVIIILENTLWKPDYERRLKK